jgi:serine/threonine protein phosphatase PrpC
MTLALRYAVRSDVGLLREGNEDSAYAGPHLLAVADGMGGHAAGEVASAAAIATIASLDSDKSAADLLPALANAVATANMRLQEMIMADPSTEGMGTTLTVLLWSDGHAALCHIGDSRAYLLRDGKFYQITHDHTLVQSLVDEGRITEDDVATHPQRSLLLRALDGRTLADPDLSSHETMPGDRYLICSDGLSGVVTEQTLHQALSSVRDPDKAALQLVELALKGGGPDNVTCIVADVVDTDFTPLPPQAPVLAGAASNGPPQQMRSAARQNSPAGRARQLRRTEPQAAVADDEDPRWSGGQDDFDDQSDLTYHGGVPARPTGSPYRRPDGEPADSAAKGRKGGRHGGQDDPDDDDAYWGRRGTGRRRWPIVTGALAVLVLALGGGAFAGWQYVQSQYYLGASNGTVALYRGVNTSVLGIGLSSLYQNTGVPTAKLRTAEQTAISSTVAYSSLSAAQQIVTRLRDEESMCGESWETLVGWQQKTSAYQAQLATYSHLAPKAKAHAKAPVNTAGSEPTVPAASSCAAASAFGIASVQLPTGTPNASQTQSATPVSTPTTSVSPSSSATTRAAKPTPSSSATRS